MAADLKSSFEDFAYASFAEFRSTLKGTPMSERMWKETMAKINDAWHASRKPKRVKRAPFTPPTPEGVTAYSIEIGWPLDGVSWCLGYATKDWCTSGSAKMKDWRLAVQKWKRDGIHTKITPTPQKAAASGLEEPPGFRPWFIETRSGGETAFRPWKQWSDADKVFFIAEMAKEKK